MPMATPENMVTSPASTTHQRVNSSGVIRHPVTVATSPVAKTATGFIHPCEPHAENSWLILSPPRSEYGADPRGACFGFQMVVVISHLGPQTARLFLGSAVIAVAAGLSPPFLLVELLTQHQKIF